MKDVQMFCDGVNQQGYGGYNAHSGSASYEVWVPFEAALRTPPRCTLHDRPYLTIGGYRQSQIIERFRTSGVITGECNVWYGFEQAAFCSPHGWAGSSSETRDHRCPHQGIAAWIARRHESTED